jgi:hypothetical protein
MAILKQLRGVDVKFGGEPSSGWIPKGASPPQSPLLRAMQRRQNADARTGRGVCESWHFLERGGLPWSQRNSMLDHLNAFFPMQ